MAVFVPLLYLIGPTYYFYIKTSISQKLIFGKSDLIHLIPAFICFLTILPFYMKSGAEKLALYDAPSPGNLELASNRILYYGLMLISWFYYSWKALKAIKSKMLTHDSRTLKAIRSRSKWLISFTYVFIGFLIFFLIVQILFVFTDLYPYYLMLSTVLASSFLIHFVGYWALKESRITGGETVSQPIHFPKAKIAQLKTEIIRLLENEKLYLQNDLSIQDLSRRLDINTKYLSQIINQEFGCSLTHLVNKYRVDEAKTLLTSDDVAHLSFLGIANSVGFNTKNTFTRTFKRHTGKTPSQFKEEMLG